MSSVVAMLTGIQLLLLMCSLGAAARAPRRASGVTGGADGGGILYVPSNESLAHCPTRCGEVTFSYPFGTEPGCFRQGFELTCDHTTRPPRLFWANSTTQILQAEASEVYASIGFVITLTPGTSNYTRSWESPAKGLAIHPENTLYVVGCDVEVVMFDTETNRAIGSCTSMCSSGGKALIGKDADVCDGLGCCSFGFSRSIRGFRFTLSRRDGVLTRPDAVPPIAKVFFSSAIMDDYEFDISNLYSRQINGSAYTVLASRDQGSCETASANKETFACSIGSVCQNADSGGYYCYCDPRAESDNPYILDGCTEALKGS